MNPLKAVGGRGYFWEIYQCLGEEGWFNDQFVYCVNKLIEDKTRLAWPALPWGRKCVYSSSDYLHMPSRLAPKQTDKQTNKQTTLLNQTITQTQSDC